MWGLKKTLNPRQDHQSNIVDLGKMLPQRPFSQMHHLQVLWIREFPNFVAASVVNFEPPETILGIMNTERIQQFLFRRIPFPEFPQG